MRKILLLILLGVVMTPLAQAQETLDYVVRFKGAPTLFAWKSLADATITTRDGQKCGKETCKLTEVWMTSENYSLLESLAPTRFLYRSYYQEQPARTLAFEKRQMKKGEKYEPYGFRHKLSVLSNDGKTFNSYVLWSEGRQLPGRAAGFVDRSSLKTESLHIKKQRNMDASAQPLDRWAMIQHARRLDLKDGYKKSFPGTNGDERLRFDVEVKGSETLQAAGKSWDTWRLRIIEHNLDEKSKQEPLSLWIAKEGARLPIRVEMDEDIGKARFELVKF